MKPIIDKLFALGLEVNRGNDIANEVLNSLDAVFTNHIENLKYMEGNLKAIHSRLVL